MRESSVVLLSGGLDSAVNLAFCAGRARVVLALTFMYGQRAAARELEAARRFCAYYDVRHEVVELAWLGALGGSALTDTSRAVPCIAAGVLEDSSACRRMADAVWVPNRNGVFVNIAAAYAERLGAVQVVAGFNREEAATFPDNSADYLQKASAALGCSTRSGVRVVSYTIDMDKKGILAGAAKLERRFPLEYVWSCYGPGPGPCGECESCRRLERAMKGQ
ncbi:MAG: 7-cyano-7-deazaguanine synthase QueC [Bdellovibrionales bacterium RIFOXYD1_FULL_53_11]|nr:MAG: 7-cyano-7-deazaguanine synthase QueC [Bdellovibrionales bacterium RIFOXYD1_FULL_53_11]